MKELNEKIQMFWNSFKEQNPDCKQKDLSDTFYFCDNRKDADECADLVVKGVKQATATSLWWFEKNKEPLPKPGDLCIVTNWNGEPKAVIQTLKIELTAFKEVSAKFAEVEGEGDKSLSYWRDVHRDYYTREMAPYNEHFSEDMIIVCEYFKTIYTHN
ncbi:MAG: ASCH domain-containing protein [Bacteroidota bacterium]